MDLTRHREAVASMFTWADQTQLANGLLLRAFALRHRVLVPLALAEPFGARRPGPLGLDSTSARGGNHPPQHCASLMFLPVLILFL